MGAKICWSGHVIMHDIAPNSHFDYPDDADTITTFADFPITVEVLGKSLYIAVWDEGKIVDDGTVVLSEFPALIDRMGIFLRNDSDAKHAIDFITRIVEASGVTDTYC